MRNPLRTEAEAFRFLLVVLAGALAIVGCAYLSMWLGVAAAILVVGGIGAWLWLSPPTPPQRPEPLGAPSPPGRYRILLLAAPDAPVTALRERLGSRLDGRRVEVLVVVPALSGAVEALTGAVDERREEARRAADALAAQLEQAGLRARGTVGADEPLLAVEDALREFGADEVVLVDADEKLLAAARERLALPVSLLG